MYQNILRFQDKNKNIDFMHSISHIISNIFNKIVFK